MANNRIFLICDLCAKRGLDERMIMIAKYYPRTGWYTTLTQDPTVLDCWLAAHTHLDELVDVAWSLPSHFSLEIEQR